MPPLFGGPITQISSKRQQQLTDFMNHYHTNLVGLQEWHRHTFQRAGGWDRPHTSCRPPCLIGVVVLLSSITHGIDIMKLLGPVKGTYFHLSVILDIFSRYVTGGWSRRSSRPRWPSD